jgi:hypothetical protein
VKPVWLRRELKKMIRSTPANSFADIREEATFLMEDSQEASITVESTPTATAHGYGNGGTIYTKPETSDLSKLLMDLKLEMKGMRDDMEALKSRN